MIFLNNVTNNFANGRDNWQVNHHPEHRFRSWPRQMTSPSHLHTQAQLQPRNTYSHTFMKFLPGHNKTISH